MKKILLCLALFCLATGPISCGDSNTDDGTEQGGGGNGGDGGGTGPEPEPGNPEITPDKICGRTTFTSAVNGDAPKSIAASYKLPSICFSFGTTDR